MIDEKVISIYCDALTVLQDNQCDFLIGGGYAVSHYVGARRVTKDLDIFCLPQEYPKILKCFANSGYRTELTDSRWLAKVFKEEHFIDIIFDTVNNICKVDETWYTYAVDGDFYGKKAKFVAPEELIWCKIYVQNRERYDSADINHLLLKTGSRLDWARLWKRLDNHWHLLLAQLLIFQFVYPSDYRQIVPDWLFQDLISRAVEQYDLPPSLEKVCRGPLIDQTQYEVDIKEWNYKAYTIKTV
ncbi:nucleotidyltransferase [Parapedobacter sp. DT-150]|uniref:nucleotidyltransferase n=1 Tax=Parapedobacter sp. DT-150 TaxID=3396162 RepID=UPI003F1978FF